ncbi:hypothetical protein LSTR_LSTR006338 [Laodelphax striatellus]|uniref:Uncharacterized protein n=1 Tax=Laodelphax striatellus TaxID=195883 RepID=A0A482XDM5_LAOST|nr:hypothetical protein LSTR_LSTR006338 [Laodelphax striatellus]
MTMIKANCVLERSGLVIRCICIPCTSEKNRGRYRSDLARIFSIFLRMLSRRLWMQHMILPIVLWIYSIRTPGIASLMKNAIHLMLLNRNRRYQLATSLTQQNWICQFCANGADTTTMDVPLRYLLALPKITNRFY